MAEQSNRGMFAVTPELFCEALHVPEGTEITGMRWDQGRNVLLVYARHPDFVEVPEGVRPPESVYQVRRYTRIAEPEDQIHTYESKWKW